MNENQIDNGNREDYSFEKYIMIGAVGVITIDDDGKLWQVTGAENGLIYCRPLSGPWTIRVVRFVQFWVLIDSI